MGGCILLSYAARPSSSNQLIGKSLYTPNAIALYSALLGLPFGVFLYSLNIVRRGDTRVGGTLCAVSGGSYLFVRVATLLGLNVTMYSFLGLFGALGLHQLESASFARGLSSGAGRARWWVPLLAVLVAGLVFDGVSYLWRR